MIAIPVLIPANPGHQMKRTLFLLSLLSLTAFIIEPAKQFAASGASQTAEPTAEKTIAFERREEMIPMRDGVCLHTLIFTPKAQTEPLPILLSRTPYGIAGTNSDGINRRYTDLAQDG